MPGNSVPSLRIPPWLRVKLPCSHTYGDTRSLVDDLRLNTVCQSAKCPNMFECFSSGTATFLILGNVCTRNCAFCNITPGQAAPPDPDEPRRVAEGAARLGLSHVVVTSVTRDDLPDGGSAHFAATVRALRSALPAAESGQPATIEVLIPDFRGSRAALDTVLDAAPDIINHNVETPPAHYPRIRPQADYAQSLELLARVRAAGAIAKSGLMVGLGETDDEVRATLADLAATGCHIATIGQYMRPSRNHPPAERYVHPDVFESYAAHGHALGIPHVFSAPLVRSSYNARAAYDALQQLRGQ
uniref:Lipoyl synthase n=1 Tax=Nitratidesulfovibrio vulgaris (strain DSM 19637 / Miyazaki F) TaxID=883 RepID=B8DRR2_NITV9